MKKNEILRRIPKIDEVLKAGGLELLFAGAGRTVVTEAARSVIQDLRNEILKMSPEELEEFDIQRMDIEAVANRVIAYMEQEDCNNLYPVINATGTILHTNLGRAPLSDWKEILPAPGRRLHSGNDCRPAKRAGGEAGGHDPRFPGRGYLGDGTVR